MSPLTVTIEHRAGESRVVASGEVDLATAPRLEEAVLGVNGHRRVVIDLEAVSFMDSSGLRSLLRLSEACRAKGQALEVVSASPQVVRLLEVTGVGRLLDLGEDGLTRAG